MLKPAPNFDTDVLAPLAAIQAKQKVEATALRLAEEQRQQQEQLDRAREVRTYQVPVEVKGDCGSWLAGAGITDISNAMYVINNESGCNPRAINASSGACGIGQALPCSKMGCSMGDGQCQMIWMNNYVMERYGSWANAVSWWRAHSWY